jgi:hypothetical protein
MIGDRPGEPDGAGLDPIPGDGGPSGSIRAFVVGVGGAMYAERVGGGRFSRRTGVPPAIGGAPSRGR